MSCYTNRLDMDSDDEQEVIIPCCTNRLDMNKEIMPFLFLLLQSEDLKRQSDRIIRELKHDSVQAIPPELLAQLTERITLSCQAELKLQTEHIGKMLVDICGDFDKLKADIETIIDKKIAALNMAPAPARPTTGANAIKKKPG